MASIDLVITNPSSQDVQNADFLIWTNTLIGKIGFEPDVTGCTSFPTTTPDMTIRLIALNRALERLMAADLSERKGKLAIDAAVREWLKPKDAGEADVERLLAWR